MLQLLLRPSVKLLRRLLLLWSRLGGAPVLDHLRGHLPARLQSHLTNVFLEVGELLRAELRSHGLDALSWSGCLWRRSRALARRHGRAGGEIGRAHV